MAALKRVKLMRGNEASRLSVTPAQGEQIMTIDEQKLYLGDGNKAGGFVVNTDNTIAVWPDQTDATKKLSLAWWIAYFNGEEATIRIPRGTHEVIYDMTIPENICLKFDKGASLKVADTKTLTINGAIEAGFWQIFDGEGTITGNPLITEVYPEWFGAKGDNETDDADAFQRSVNFYRVLKLQNKTYAVDTTVILAKDKTEILGPASINTPTAILFKADSKTGLLFKDLTIVSAYNNTEYLMSIDELTVDANGFRKTQGIINVAGSTDVSVIECNITGGYSCASITTSDKVNIKGCDMTLGSHILCLTSQSKNVLIENNAIHDIAAKEVPRAAYLIQATGSLVKYTIIRNNRLYGNPVWDAIMSHQGESFVVSDNLIYDVRCGIDFSSSTKLISDIVINNNFISDTEEGDLSWTGLNHAISLVGNTTYPLTNITISNNRITGFGTYPAPNGSCQLSLDYIKNCVITGNNLIFTANSGGDTKGVIGIKGFCNVTISNNNFEADAYSINIRPSDLLSESLNIVSNNFKPLTETTVLSFIKLLPGTDIVKLNIDNNNIGSLRALDSSAAASIDGVSPPTSTGGLYPRKKWRIIQAHGAITIPANGYIRVAVSVPSNSVLVDSIVIPVLAEPMSTAALTIRASRWDSGAVALCFTNISSSSITINAGNVFLSVINYL